MYEFHDLTPATKGEVKGRMAESFSFNGVWIEDEIPQFVVTGTTGRELMEAERSEEHTSELQSLSC